MDETTAPAAVGQAADARPEGFSSVAAAVAEMDRREKARAAERKAEKAKDAPDDTDTDDGEADGRKPPKRVDGIDDEEKEPKPKKGKAAEEELDDADDSEDAEEGDEDDADDSEEGEADEDDEPRKKPKADEQAPQKIKLRFDGREVEATPEHVQEYVEHTARAVQEVRAEREQVVQARQYIQQQAQAMQQQAQALAQLAQHVIGAEPSLELAQSDPQSYLVQQGLFQQRQQVFQQLLQHAQTAASQAHAETQQTTQSRKAAGQRALFQAMPELADPQKLAAFTGRALKVAQEYGYSPQDVDATLHPGFYVMLRDLARLRDMEASRVDVRKKLTGAPPLKTPERRASAGPKDTQGLRSKDAKRAFIKSNRSMRDVRDYLDRTSR